MSLTRQRCGFFLAGIHDGDLADDDDGSGGHVDDDDGDGDARGHDRDGESACDVNTAARGGWS